jgi:hypothetical protein
VRFGIRLLPILCLAFAAACGPAGPARGNVYLDSTEIVLRESYPVQAVLLIRGSLPTPCHELKVEVSSPDTQNRIWVDVYSVSDPSQVCIQVLEPFEETAELGRFTQGSFSVWVNGEPVGEIEL